jgi:replication initiation protein RepC
VPALPLHLVVRAAPDIETFGNRRVRDWRDLVAAADHARPMMGISADAWAEARRVMGDATAATTLACVLQSSGRIRSPGGYLRSLTERAARGVFSPGPMVMALLRAENATPA